MSWSEHDSGQVNQVIQGDDNSTNDFDDIASSSFHRDSSLLMDVSGTSSIGFSDIAGSSFRYIENLSLRRLTRRVSWETKLERVVMTTTSN